MPFLNLSNADMSFGKKTLTWKFYTINEILLTTKQVQIVNSEKFVITVLDADSKTFVIYVAIREREKMLIHLKKLAQIKTKA